MLEIFCDIITVSTDQSLTLTPAKPVAGNTVTPATVTELDFKGTLSGSNPIQWSTLSYAKSAPARPGDQLNGFKNSKTVLAHNLIYAVIML